MLKVTYTGVKQIFYATEEVRHLDAVALVSGAIGLNYAELGREYLSGHIAAGIAYGAVSGTVSGQIIRVVTHGIVSGVRLGIGAGVGDRLALASAGRVMPLNTISPEITLISGGALAGGAGVDDTALSCSSGITSGVTGAWFPTGQSFAKALYSGAAGDGIPILVGG